MKILLAAALIVSASAAAAAPPPVAPAVPPAVAAHVHDRHFDPGDYGWLRGAFPGASPAEVADWVAIRDYGDHCGGTVPEAIRAEMTAMGEHPPTDYWHPYADDVCGEVGASRPTLVGFSTWVDYRRALDTALPYYRTLIFAVAQVKTITTDDDGALRDRLLTIVVPDQMLRLSLSWGQGEASDAPPLDAKARSMLTALLWRPIRDIDDRNTAWLKNQIAKGGWPTISKVGKQAAKNAWLLAQHADADPVFQLRVLRLIEPLAKQGEVDRGHYALLYDRVMLPLTGKQRYGTQFTCDDKGGWRPQALESEGAVDARRKEVGLPPIADYKKQMIATYGEHCGS